MNYTHNDEAIYAPSPDIFGEGEAAAENGEARDSWPQGYSPAWRKEWLRGFDSVPREVLA